MKVLHLPHNVGSNPWSLSRGERALGLDSDTLSLETYRFQYPTDQNLNLQGRGAALKLATLTKAFFDNRKKYDVFHFNFGRSLVNFPGKGLHSTELPFYPKNKKKFVTYQGCDARQKFPTMERSKVAACHQADCYNGQCNSGRLDELRRIGIQKMAEHVDHMWAVNPDLLYFLPKEKSSFLPYAVSIPEERMQTPSFEGELTIVHAPTNRAAKGSSFIIEAVENVQKRNPGKLRLVLVENLTHSEAQKVYRRADIVIDQILIGWYGAFAVESMYLGKPVIARIANDDLHFLPNEMAKDVQDTVIGADPYTIEDVIERAIADRHFLQQRAEASLSYAHRWHNPVHVAAVTKAKYEE